MAQRFSLGNDDMPPVVPGRSRSPSYVRSVSASQVATMSSSSSQNNNKPPPVPRNSLIRSKSDQLYQQQQQVQLSDGQNLAFAIDVFVMQGYSSNDVIAVSSVRKGQPPRSVRWRQQPPKQQQQQRSPTEFCPRNDSRRRRTDFIIQEFHLRITKWRPSQNSRNARPLHRTQKIQSTSRHPSLSVFLNNLIQLPNRSEL